VGWGKKKMGKKWDVLLRQGESPNWGRRRRGGKTKEREKKKKVM